MTDICDDFDNFSNFEIRMIGDGQGWRANALYYVIAMHFCYLTLFVTIGIVIVTAGWDAMQNSSYDGEDSASSSPIGMVLAGFSTAAILFNFLRLDAARRITENQAAMKYLIKNLADYK